MTVITPQCGPPSIVLRRLRNRNIVFKNRNDGGGGGGGGGGGSNRIIKGTPEHSHNKVPTERAGKYIQWLLSDQSGEERPSHSVRTPIKKLTMVLRQSLTGEVGICFLVRRKKKKKKLPNAT